MLNKKQSSYLSTTIIPILLIFTFVILMITIYQPSTVVIRTPSIEVELDK